MDGAQLSSASHAKEGSVLNGFFRSFEFLIKDNYSGARLPGPNLLHSSPAEGAVIPLDYVGASL